MSAARLLAPTLATTALRPTPRLPPTSPRRRSPAPITATGKTYDGTTAASTNGTLSGILGDDKLSLSTSGSFADKNAGTAKLVNVSGALAGVDAGNYSVTTNATTTADIAAKAITGAIAATGKTYDGTTAAATNGTLSGVGHG